MRFEASSGAHHAQSGPSTPRRGKNLQALGYVGAGSSGRTRDPSEPLADPKDKIELFALIREASTDLDQGRWEDAASKLERVVTEDPNVPEAHNILGNVHERRGDLEGAIVSYQHALERDPGYKPALFSLAMAYQELGRLDAAYAGYERILSLDPKATQASFQMARIRIDQKRYAEALERLESLVATSEDEEAVAENLRAESYLGLGEGDKAEEVLLSAIRRKADLPGAHYNLGVLAEQRGHPQRAVEAYEKELEIAPDSYRAHFNLAKLLGQSGDEPRMIQHLKKALEANPRFATGHLYLANALLEGGDLTGAMTHAQEGLASNPDPSLAPLGHFILSDVYRAMGRMDDAAREMATAQRLQH